MVNTDNNSLMIGFIFLVVLVVYLFWYINSKNYKYEEEDNEAKGTSFEKTKVINIRIENKTNEELNLNLLKLDKEDSRYKVHCICDYDMLSEYSKTNLFYAKRLRISFTKRETFLKVATLRQFSPYSNITSKEKLLIVPADDYNKIQYQANIIDAPAEFVWSYFDDINFKVVGNEDYTISVYTTEEPSEEINKRDEILFGLILGNDTNEVKQIKLLNPEFWSQHKYSPDIDIKSYLPNIPYDGILQQCQENGFYSIKKLKFFNYEGNSFDSDITLNHKKFKISEYKTENQFQPDSIDVDFERNIPSANFTIELQPKSKIIMIAK